MNADLGETVYRKRNHAHNKIVDHLVLETSSKTICGQMNVTTTISGKVHKAAVHSFRGLENRDNWCSRCRKKFEELKKDSGGIENDAE